MELSMRPVASTELTGTSLRNIFRVQNLLALALVLLAQGAPPAKADTLTGVFSNPVLVGSLLNYPTYGSTTYADDTNTAVIGTATPGGANCGGGNVLCWGSGAGLGIPASQQFSKLVFKGSTSFNGSSSQNQFVGTISYDNGTSTLGTVIFGATLSFYDNGTPIGSDNVIISTTSNQLSGTGLTQKQLATDADYFNICGNDSNLCTSSIEAFEDSEGGEGLDVDLTGNLVGDPTLILNGVSQDASQAGCTTCGTIGTELPLAAETPEPASLALVATGCLLLFGLAQRSMRTSVKHTPFS